MGWGELVGAAAGHLWDAGNLKRQNSANKAATREARAWEGMMAATSHQREVKDLVKAGLNPVLSAMGGSGAATPNSPVFHAESESPGNTAERIRIALLQEEQLRNMVADTQQKRANERLNLWQIDRVLAEVKSLNAGAKLTEATAQGVHLDNIGKQIEANFWNENNAAKIGQSLGIDAGTVLNIFKLLKGFKR